MDPDNNFLNNLFGTTDSNEQSPYFTVEQLNKLDDSPRSFSVINVNIRSYRYHIDEYLAFLQSLTLEFKVLVFTESWLNSDDSITPINCYIGYHTFREGRGGGVSVFCDQSYSSEKINRLSFVNDNMESCVVRIRHNNQSVFIIGIYRPPSGIINEFCSLLLGIINDALLKKCDIVIVGDMNINLLEVGAWY